MTNDELLNKFPFFSQQISKIFHHQTELENFLEEGKKPFSHKIYITVNYKGYPRFEKIRLPKPRKIFNFHKAMMERKSSREFLGKNISTKELSTLLYYTAGLRSSNHEDLGNRFYPSAGARYPIEIYPIIFKCDSIRSGIYHYHVKTHSLEFMWTYPNLIDQVFMNIKQQFFKKSSVIFVITAISSRTEQKYGPRGYRHILMEVGHVSQNLYLTASGLGLGICSIGGYLDTGFNTLLDLDGFLEKTMLIAALGTLKGGDKNAKGR